MVIEMVNLTHCANMKHSRKCNANLNNGHKE